MTRCTSVSQLEHSGHRHRSAYAQFPCRWLCMLAAAFNTWLSIVSELQHHHHVHLGARKAEMFLHPSYITGTEPLANHFLHLLNLLQMLNSTSSMAKAPIFQMSWPNTLQRFRWAPLEDGSTRTRADHRFRALLTNPRMSTGSTPAADRRPRRWSSHPGGVRRRICKRQNKRKAALMQKEMPDHDATRTHNLW
jgi:hypothetical protein